MQIPKLNFSEIETQTFDNVIDVRSPAEFAMDHIDGAINLPVLSNNERSLVGTTYKQDSRFKARKIGAALIAKNTAQHLESELFSKDRNWRPLIYCWRGGQRSTAFSTILSEIGWRPTLLNGGYKNYRKEVSEIMHKKPVNYDFILISGHTGTAKTEIIRKLENLNMQTIDLEGLANHRGSIFGANLTKQPSQKLFESFLFNKLTSFNYRKPIILESESNKIGQIAIPSMVWNAMKKSPRIEVNAPLRARAHYLTKTYKNLIENQHTLEKRIEFLINQHGHKKVQEWKDLSKAGKFSELATELVSYHYDPRYKNCQKYSQDMQLPSVSMNTITKQSILSTAKRISEIVNSIAHN